VVQLPSSPPPWLWAWPHVSFAMEYRAMAVFSLRSQSVAQPEWGRRNHGSPEKNLLRFFTAALDQFLHVKKTSVTDDFTDCPSRTNFLAALQVAAIGSSMNFSCFYLNAGCYNAFCQSKWLPCRGHKDMSYFNDDNTRRWSEGAAISCWNCRCCSTNRSDFRFKNEADLFLCLNVYWWCIYYLPY